MSENNTNKTRFIKIIPYEFITISFSIAGAAVVLFYQILFYLNDKGLGVINAQFPMDFPNRPGYYEFSSLVLTWSEKNVYAFLSPSLLGIGLISGIIDIFKYKLKYKVLLALFIIIVAAYLYLSHQLFPWIYSNQNYLI